MVTAGTVTRAVPVQKTKYLIFINSKPLIYFIQNIGRLGNLKQHFSEMETFEHFDWQRVEMPGKDKHQWMDIDAFFLLSLRKKTYPLWKEKELYVSGWQEQSSW